MEKEIKKQLTTLACILVPLLGFVTYGFLRTGQENKLLDQESCNTIALIADTYVGTKARDFVRYEFIVDGVMFDGHQRYYPQFELVEIGDTCEVIYAKSNPNINKLLTNKDKSLKIIQNSIEYPPLN